MLEGWGAALGLISAPADAAPMQPSKDHSPKDKVEVGANHAKEKPESNAAVLEFFNAAYKSACALFGTVLGPEANEAHRDHFYLDMKARETSSFCQ